MSEETEFPKSIEEFGYQFNEKGELRNIQTGERFEFFVKPGDRHYNQRHYEELGEVIGEFIEDELVKDYNLIRKIIPVGSEKDDDVAKSRIYLSDNVQECQTLLLLIQGSGVVRPGQWARQVIINESLELGTMFPYIRKAQELKWGIVIFNPNENYGSISKDGEVRYCHISGSESPQKHCLYVWDKFVSNAKAENILIVAHSYGGICTAYMLDCFADDFYKRVKGIALTDSVHGSGMIPERSRRWFSKKAFNWIKSTSPMNEPIHEADQFYGCSCFSAGHSKHEYTSGVAIESVFEFLKFRSKEKRNKDNDETTSQKDETSEQSSVSNNNKVDKDSKEAKPQSQSSSNSITREKGTTTTKDPQPNSMDFDEPLVATNSENNTNITKGTPLDSGSAMEIDKPLETTNEISSENDSKATRESLGSGSDMETEEFPKATSTENDNKANGEPQLNPVSNELSIVTDEPVTNETTTYAVTKDTEKAMLKAEMGNAFSNPEEIEKESFTNDKEPHEVKYDTSENKEIVNDTQKEITTNSNTSAQALNDNNNSKDYSQNNV